MSINNTKYLFESERLGFRYWEDEDSEFYTALCQDKKVMEFFPHIPSVSEAKGEMFYIDDKLRTAGFGFWAVELKETQELVGDIGMQKVPFESFFTPAFEIGWRVAHKYWRQGFAKEGASRILEYALEKNITNKIISYTAKQNIPSQILMQKLEMIYLGEFNHPHLDEDHPLAKHLLYEKTIQNHNKN